MPATRAYVPNMSALMTADQLMHVNIPGKQVELVRGVLVVREPPGIPLDGEDVVPGFSCDLGAIL
jgi:hypothetical protein